MNVSRIRRIENKINLTQESDLIRVDIGCGDRKLSDPNGARQNAGYIGIDIEDYGQEIVWDVESGIPLQNNSCIVIFCSHTVEHLDDFIGFMNECWRVLYQGAELHIVVPHKNNEKALVPSHVRLFDEQTFRFFEHPEYVDGYQCKGWEIIDLVVNDRKDMHVRMVPKK